MSGVLVPEEWCPFECEDWTNTGEMLLGIGLNMNATMLRGHPEDFREMIAGVHHDVDGLTARLQNAKNSGCRFASWVCTFDVAADSGALVIDLALDGSHVYCFRAAQPYTES